MPYPPTAMGQPTAYPPAPVKKRSSTPLIIGIAVGVVVLAIVAAFVVPRLLAGGGQNGHSYQPSGPERAWLDERYSAGVLEPWQLNEYEMVIGLSASGAVLATAENDATTGYFVTGRDLATGAQRWQIEGIGCSSSGSTQDGSAVCLRLSQDGGGEWLLLDLETGAERVLFTADSWLAPFDYVGSHNGAVIGTTGASEGTQVLALSGAGSIAWQVTYPDSYQCQLTGTHVSCQTILEDSYFVIDAATGETTVEPNALTDERSITWGSEGYAVRQSIFDIEPGPLLDFQGVEVGQTIANTPNFPNWTEGVFYSNADFQIEEYSLAVDRDGRSVAEFGESFGGYRIVATGAERELDLHSVTGDGKTFLEADISGETPALLTEDGQVIVELDKKIDSFLTEGIILTANYTSAEWVIPPAG